MSVVSARTGALFTAGALTLGLALSGGIATAQTAQPNEMEEPTAAAALQKLPEDPRELKTDSGEPLPLITQPDGTVSMPMIKLNPDGTVSPQETSPADCHFQPSQKNKPQRRGEIANAHIASSVDNATKVNSWIHCDYAVSSLANQTSLFHRGFLSFPIHQATTTTDNSGQRQLSNQGTYRHCEDDDTNEWYGTAYGASVEDGQTYLGFGESTNTSGPRAEVDCGT